MWEPSDKARRIAASDSLRSQFVRQLVEGCAASGFAHDESASIPKTIIQFWDDASFVPSDVADCMNSWRQLGKEGYEYICFDDQSARNFISSELGSIYAEAFDSCYHPAMRSDYFRICYLFMAGGCYVDADDVFTGENIDYLFSDVELKLQPLCYDCETAGMVEPDVFANPDRHSDSWIYYFNNNPIISPPKNPILEYAIAHATRVLLCERNTHPEIQSTTGPGNLTASLVARLATMIPKGNEERPAILKEWGRHARTVWELSYREDVRNWRLSNQKPFSAEP